MIAARKSTLTALALVLAASVVCGCGGSRSDIAEVSGTVTLDGEPLPNAQVQFIPKGGTGSSSFGKTDSSGNYSMMFSRSVPGASLGESSIRISTADVNVQDGEEVVVKERVPPKYNSKSELVENVQLGSNTFNFTLVSGVEEITQPELTE